MGLRREKVVLDLDGNFTSQAARCAAASAVLDKALDHTGSTADRAGPAVDRYSGRLGLLADAIVGLTPTLAPLGAAGAGAIAGFSNQLGFAVLGIGTAIVAFKGLGDAFKAIDAANLDPSAANLQKMHEVLSQLDPTTRQFVRHLEALKPQLTALQTAARQGLLPGVQDGIDTLLARAPQLQAILRETGDTLGGLTREGAKALAGPQFDDFFAMIQRDARPILTDMGHALGDVVKGLADLWVAFEPLNRDFSAGLAKGAEDFAQWADGLSRTQGFQDFLNYIETSGPQVLSTVGSISNALLQIIEAAAPLGGPTLAIIRAFADAIGAIADSDIGTPLIGGLIALRAYSRLMQVVTAQQRAFNAEQAGGSRFNPAAQVQNTRGQILQLGQLRGAYKESAAAAKSFRAAQSEANVAQGRYLGSLRANSSSMALGLPNRGGSVEKNAAAFTAASEKQAAASRRVAEAERTKATALREGAAGAGKSAAAIGALTVASTGLGNSLGITNTASLALAGSMIAPGIGTALGATAGAFVDAKSAADGYEASLRTLRSASDLDALTVSVKRFKAESQDMYHVSGKGNAKLADFFSDIQKQVGTVVHGDFGASRSGAAKAIQEAQAKINNLRTERAADGMRALGGAGKVTAAGMATATSSTAKFEQSLEHLNAQLEGRSSMRDFQASIDDFTKSLKENGQTLDINTEKGRNNQAALDNIAATGIKVADYLKKSGQDGAAAAMLDQTRTRFVRAAVAAGMLRGEARKLADNIGLLDQTKANVHVNVLGVEEAKAETRDLVRAVFALPAKVRTDIVANGVPKTQAGIAALQRRYNLTPRQVQTITRLRDLTPPQIARVMAALRRVGGQRPSPTITAKTAQAVAAIGQVQSYLNGLHDKTVTVAVQRAGQFGPYGNLFGKPTAGGGTVPTSGRGYADRYPYLLADGEEVISNRYGQADRHRDLLKAINSNRLASGGTVKQTPAQRAAEAAAKKKKAASAKRAGEIRSAQQDFKVDDYTFDSVHDAVFKFAHDVQAAGGHLGKNFGVLSNRLQMAASKFDQLSAAMDDLRSKQDAARSGAQGAFNNNAFGGSVADFYTQISADTNDSNSTRAAIANLASKGASADFLAALSGSSNAGLANQFAGLSAAEVQRASQAYSIREYTSALQGQQAADQYQPAVNATAAQIAATQRQEQALALAVRNGAAAGTAGKARAAKTKAKGRRR